MAAVKLLSAVGFRARPVTAAGLPLPDEDTGESPPGRGEVRGLSAECVREQVQAAVEAGSGSGSDSGRSERLTLLLVMAEPPTETEAGREAWKVGGLVTPVM